MRTLYTLAQKKLNSESELDVSRRVSVSRHVFECLGLAMPMPRLGLGPCKSRKVVMSRSRREKILDLKQHSGL